MFLVIVDCFMYRQAQGGEGLPIFYVVIGRADRIYRGYRCYRDHRKYSMSKV